MSFLKKCHPFFTPDFYFCAMRSNIPIDDFDYPLPDERIARHPLPQRDASRLQELPVLRNIKSRDVDDS